jgi:hypothetical protein
MRRAALAAALLLGLIGAGARAQQIEPRSYANAPVGVNFLLGGYVWTDGGVSVDPSIPLQDGHITTDAAFVAYARTIAIGSLSGKVDAALPYGWLTGTATYAGTPVRRDVNGFGDLRMRLSVNLYGAPAVDAQQFRAYRQDLIVGASLQVTAPSGQYDPDRLVNIGTNRWSVKPEVGVSKALGAWILELAAAATIYTVNFDFYGGNRFSQDPVYAFQGHVIYNFRPGLWAAVDGTWYGGGRSCVNGDPSGDLKGSTRVGLTLALPVTVHNAVKLYGSTGLSTRTGDKFDAIGVAWQYRWGGGV